ncbi:hypothetical protein G6F57_021978 [Rhizopus arrhizus]|nr:hypothetical protein G6F57_021978 [Rhizopus arrhizus]
MEVHRAFADAQDAGGFPAGLARGGPVQAGGLAVGPHFGVRWRRQRGQRRDRRVQGGHGLGRHLQRRLQQRAVRGPAADGGHGGWGRGRPVVNMSSPCCGSRRRQASIDAAVHQTLYL